MPARGSVHDPRSEPPRGRRRSRLPPASRHRMVAASDGRGSATRIPAHLVARSETAPIEELIELPLMSDPASLATLDVLTKLVPPALYTDANLLSLVICRAVNLSLERGNSDASCVAYVSAWLIAGPRFGDYQAGFRFGRLGYELVEQRGLKRFQARIYLNFGNIVMPWTRHVRAGRDLVRRAFEAANQIGDLTFAASCYNQLNTNLLAAGDPLAEVQREAERVSRLRRRCGSVSSLTSSEPQLGLIRTLRGLTPTFGSFDDEGLMSIRFERRLASNPVLAWPSAGTGSASCRRAFLPATMRASMPHRGRNGCCGHHHHMFETAEYQLLRCACPRGVLRSAPPTSGSSISRLWPPTTDNSKYGRRHCPENFENRAALVGAEIARIEGRELDAMHLYEQAIRSAQRKRLCPQRGARQRARRALLRSARLRANRAPISAKRPVLLPALGRRRQGAATRSSCIRTSETEEPRAGSDEHDRGAGRTPRSRDGDQGVASRIGRDRPGEADRHAHAHGD